MGLRKGNSIQNFSFPSINRNSGIAGDNGTHKVPKQSTSELTHAEPDPIPHRSEQLSRTYRKVMCDYLEVYGIEQDTFENWRNYSTSAVWLEAYSLVDRDIAHDLVEFRDEAIAYSMDVKTVGDITLPPHQLFYQSYARALIRIWKTREDLGLIDDAEIMKTSEELLASQYGDKIYRILGAMGRRVVVEKLFDSAPELIPMVERVSTKHKEEAYNFSPLGEPLKC